MVGTHTCTLQELLRWLTALLCFIDAQSESLGQHVRAFCLDPGMPEVDVFILHALVLPWDDRQLAAVLISSIPAEMGQLISTKIPNMVAAAGFLILREICSPHYGVIALKA